MLKAAGTDPFDKWKPINSSQSRDVDFNVVVYGNNTFIAVGTYGTIVKLPNSMNWSSLESGITTDLYGVGYCNNTFVAVGDSGTILTSIDGITYNHRIRKVDSAGFVDG